MKIGFPYKDENRKNSFTEILKNLRDKDSSFIKTYFVTIMLSLISFNYFSFNTFLSFLNEFPEILIILFSPIIMFFFIIILNICDAVYFIFLWFYNLYLFLDMEIGKNADETDEETTQTGGGGEGDIDMPEPSAPPEESTSEKPVVEASGEPVAEEVANEEPAAEEVANEEPADESAEENNSDNPREDNLFMLCLLFCFRLWLIWIFIMILFGGLMFGGVILIFPFITFMWVFFSLFNYNSKMIINGKNVETTSKTIIKEVFMYYKNIIMIHVSIILISTIYTFFGSMPSVISMLITIAFFIWTNLFKSYEEEDLSLLNHDKSAEKPWDYKEFLPPDENNNE
jgi:hypothetical protein